MNFTRIFIGAPSRAPVEVRTAYALVCLVTAFGMLGCSDEPGLESETAELATGQAATNDEGFALFADPASELPTADIYDINGDVIQINAERGALVWADGSEIPGWSTVDEFILVWDVAPFAFRVAFGSEGGERRAYFTEVTSRTICDLYLVDVQPGLAIAGTGELPPSN